LTDLTSTICDQADVLSYNLQLTAMLLITVGTTIQTIFGDFSHFLDDNFLSPPTLMVVAGVILLIVALFGCIGALRESTLLINVVSYKPAIVLVVYLKKILSYF
jgi:CD63 antigen